MEVTKITSKHQATVPAEVRAALGLKAGDAIEWVVDDAGVARVRKATPLDLLYLKGVDRSLAEEWLSDADMDAWREL
jgi:antitoxin PrlF